ncbi:MAG TPA: hypothetical protein VKA60_20375 [Blastocatellia bacterium]|nr:hypothetical protein [Blastocatellia bacterium]
MPRKRPKPMGPIKPAVEGTKLEADGPEVKQGLWEVGIYLGTDGFVYHIVAEANGSAIDYTIISKRPVGEYLRWVDGLFRPGQVPSEFSGIHFRAAKKLRELI